MSPLVLTLLFCLTYINDLSSDLRCIPKLLTDNTSLFSAVRKSETTTNNLTSELNEISKWIFQWKMNFNPDLSKEEKEVIFSWKVTKVSHPKTFPNKVLVSQVNSQKDLGLILDSTLTFAIHIKSIWANVNKRLIWYGNFCVF